MPDHHPLIRTLPRWNGVTPKGLLVDCIGIKTRLKFLKGMMTEYVEAQNPGATEPPLPAFDEEYFEWIDVLEAVTAARDRFVMIELGAGYGRWLVRAVAALRQVNPLPFALVAVEAEPTHFAWIHEHLRDNDIDAGEHELIEAAVNATGEPVIFHVGNPSGWYGQAIDVNAPSPPPEWRDSARAQTQAAVQQGAPESAGAPDEASTGTVPVEAVTLTDILQKHPRVDLIDLDVQGAELDVLRAAIDELDRRVKRLHIGTHSAEIEAGLRKLFPAHGWDLVHDFHCLKPNATPYGDIEFGDGVQSWVNPRL